MTKEFVDESKWQQIVQDVLQLAREKGASSAEVSAHNGDGFSLNVRMGDVETIEYHRDKGLDITVYFDHQQGSSSTTEVTKNALESAVSAACNIAKATSTDPCNGLADEDLMAKNYPDLDLYHPWSLDVPAGIALAKQCEDEARAYDKRITNSEGASLSTYQNYYILANSLGFVGSYYTSRHSMSCVLLAEKADQKQRDYEYTAARDPEDLTSVTKLARLAAEKTIKRLDAKRLTTRQSPVVFTPQMAGGLIGNFVSAIRGGNLYRQATFLLDFLGKAVFPENIQITENPFIKKGSGSAPFDGEGVRTVERTVVKNGILQNYILDSYSARKLGMKTTGNAGGVHNLVVQPTTGDLHEVLSQMNTGLLVTELMGHGVNIVTGDYSRGAAGFWVEQGEIKYPVHEITIAGNLRDMFAHIRAAGNDIDRRGSICSGSLLIENMTIAGE